MFLPDDTRFWVTDDDAVNVQPGKCTICYDLIPAGVTMAFIEWAGPPGTCWARAHLECVKQSSWNIENQPALDLGLEVAAPDPLGAARQYVSAAKHALEQDSNASRGRLNATTALVKAMDNLVQYAETLRRPA